jgi:hypothetical protein
MKKWYNKFDKKTKIGSLNCPNCDFNFEKRLWYIIEPNICPHCDNKLGLFDVSPYHQVIYTIDLECCPELIRVIFDYLCKEEQPYQQLKELALMLLPLEGESEKKDN